MPSYYLQVVTNFNPPLQTAGELVISQNAQGNFAAQFTPENGGHTVHVHNAQYSNTGGGTFLNPNAGDTLNLHGFVVTVQGQTFPCNGSATYRAPGDDEEGGYYTSGGADGLPGDWDAADGSGEP